MIQNKEHRTQIMGWCAFFVVMFIGVILRLYRITAHEFIYYDEGMYLNHGREIMEKVWLLKPWGMEEYGKVLSLISRLALHTAKSLWFFIASLRVFWGGFGNFEYLRLLTALSGLLTVGMTYLLARRYFDSKKIGLFSAALLVILPGHVFYSRLAMQEGLSALLFLTGLYCYLFWNKGWRVVLAGILFAGVYHTNYRLIIIPLLLLGVELFQYVLVKEKLQWKRWVITTAIFAALVFGFGLFEDGANLKANFGWMFIQAQDATDEFHWINLIAYPYYLFKLETILFGFGFFFSIWLCYLKQWSKLLPFVLVCLQMLIFTFAAEQGARYLCVMYPLACMAVANVIDYWQNKDQSSRIGAVVFSVVLFAFCIQQSLLISQSKTAYGSSITFLKTLEQEPKILTTQPTVHSLFLSKKSHARKMPLEFKPFLMHYAQGYRFMVLDPQAYVSWAYRDHRFNEQMLGFLEFAKEKVPPLVEFDHFNRTILERFVFDHNKDLAQSTLFLKSADEFGKLRIYDMQLVIKAMSAKARSVSNE